jgi:ribosomal protein S18 acetylase RimI-like enzyme
VPVGHSTLRSGSWNSGLLDFDACQCHDACPMASPRRATPVDIDEVTSIVTQAFANDPLWSRAMARPDGNTEHHADFWRLFVEGALRYPETWITDEGEATSIWIPPDGTEMSDEQEDRLGELVAEYLGSAAVDYHELMGRLDAAHPRGEPHYYLSLLGTHPQHRGHGIGMKLLAHNLAIIDAEHRPAYLESSNPNNNNRYRRLGFEPHGEFSYPGGGPVVTTMWRPAR